MIVEAASAKKKKKKNRISTLMKPLGSLKMSLWLIEFTLFAGYSANINILGVFFMYLRRQRANCFQLPDNSFTYYTVHAFDKSHCVICLSPDCGGNGIHERSHAVPSTLMQQCTG